jgi:hypothetical protein
MVTNLDNQASPNQFDVFNSFASLNAMSSSSQIQSKLRSSLPQNGFSVHGFQDALTKVKP